MMLVKFNVTPECSKRILVEVSEYEQLLNRHIRWIGHLFEKERREHNESGSCFFFRANSPYVYTKHYIHITKDYTVDVYTRRALYRDLARHFSKKSECVVYDPDDDIVYVTWSCYKTPEKKKLKTINSF
jgi:hypothetical protein